MTAEDVEVKIQGLQVIIHQLSMELEATELLPSERVRGVETKVVTLEREAEDTQVRGGHLLNTPYQGLIMLYSHGKDSLTHRLTSFY